MRVLAVVNEILGVDATVCRDSGAGGGYTGTAPRSYACCSQGALTEGRRRREIADDVIQTVVVSPIAAFCGDRAEERTN